MNIGERLRKAREAIGYTQPVAAGKSGIGVSSISEFETGKREPSFSQLSKLAEIYKKSIDFFLTDSVPEEAIQLWRDPPTIDEERKETEAKFRQLCKQYHRLELCRGEVKTSELPSDSVSKREEFNYPRAEFFARKVRDLFSLGDIPGQSLKPRLEETYHVKIFYLDFPGSAISTVSPVFGPAILLNRKNKPWRRTYDLAHELFHLLTWSVFRAHGEDSLLPGENEEKFANKFASILLMPEESLRERINAHIDADGQLGLQQLGDISREFDVSLVALIYRIATMFMIPKEKTLELVKAAQKFVVQIRPRESNEPPTLPERYCRLAQQALREGKLSLMQFAKYMNLSYKKAQEYLTEDDEFRDEKISIPIA